MKAKLWILVASLLVCGANVALAQRDTARSAKALACSQESCRAGDNEHCTALGCTGCTDFPVGYRCYLQIEGEN